MVHLGQKATSPSLVSFGSPKSVVIQLAKPGGAQGLSEFAGIQIQTEQGKPLMAIPQGHQPGLEMDPFGFQILAGENQRMKLRPATCDEKSYLGDYLGRW